MGRKLGELAAEAFQMDVQARAVLAKPLLDSLDETFPEDPERLWVEEAESRNQVLRAGEF